MHVASVPALHGTFQHTSTHGLVGALYFSLVLLIYVVNLNLMAEWWFAILAVGVGSVILGQLQLGTMESFIWASWDVHGGCLGSSGDGDVDRGLYYVVAPELPDILTEMLWKRPAHDGKFWTQWGLVGAAELATMQEVYTWKDPENSAGGMVMWVVSLIVAAVCKRRSRIRLIQSCKVNQRLM